jgi:hypothetical protein
MNKLTEEHTRNGLIFDSLHVTCHGIVTRCVIISFWIMSLLNPKVTKLRHKELEQPAKNAL